jgi:GTP cyclohydrolase II
MSALPHLQTNNPRKINILTSLGIPVSGRIPCQVAAGKYNQVSSSSQINLQQQQLAAEAAAAADSGSSGNSSVRRSNRQRDSTAIL